MIDVVFAENPLDRKSWLTFKGESNLADFLLREVAPLYNGVFPSSARIYHEYITKDHDITPTTPADADHLLNVTGTAYVVIWPAGHAIAAQLAVSGFIWLATTAVKQLISTPDEKVTSRNIPKGSPNNIPGQRTNSDRAQQRIPDIYGRVKSTPDLIQYPFIKYQGNLQTELCAYIIGRGEFNVFIPDILEGKTQVSQIPGASVAVYPPNEIPFYGTPQIQVGEDILDPIYNIIPVREVTGENLLAPNNTYIFGDDDENSQFLDDDLFPPRAPRFTYPSTGVGVIRFGNVHEQDRSANETQAYFTNRLNVGDKFGMRWQGDATGAPTAMKARGAVSTDAVDLIMGAGGDANIPNLELMPLTPDDDHYEVTAINLTPSTIVEYTISVPASKQAEWAKIATFNPGPDEIYNRMVLIYVLNYRLGPFFCDDPNMQSIYINLVAEKGLWIDDGVKQRAYGVKSINVPTSFPGGIEFIVEVTPADEDGIASGIKELHPITLYGSASKRDFIGESFKIAPSFTGRFLISVYRNLWQYWRTKPTSWFVESATNHVETNWAEEADTINGQPVMPNSFQYADEVKWTHAYSLSDPTYPPDPAPIESFGQVTIVHSKISQVKLIASKENERNLNIIATRIIPVFNNETFLGDFATVSGKDAAIAALNDYYIGNVPDANIDYVGIQAAFLAATLALGDTEATSFSHTFDSEQVSLEDILSAIGDSCFVTFYRQGDIIKATADVSKTDSTLLFNHRNKLPGTETRTVSFGTDEDYDGVEVEYTDDTDNQLKSYIAPITILPPRNTQKIRVAGIRTRAKAAMHAWRAANKLLYQNTVVEFDACEEACLSIIKDKVLVADGTRTDVQDGYITRIDGLTVYTSQEINISGGGQTFTLFIQDVDGSVQAIPVVAEDTPHSLILDGAPSGTLVIDEDANIFPHYFLVRDQSTTPKAFLVTETSYKNRGVYSVTAVNYSEGYYFYDAIRLWVPLVGYSGMFPPILTKADRSPYEWEFVEVGTPGVTNDANRGSVYTGDGSSYIEYTDLEYPSSAQYTAACWVNPDTSGGVICRSMASLNSFIFSIDSLTDDIVIFHDGVEVARTAEVPLNEWTHVAVTYNAATEILRIYINGDEAGIAIDVPEFADFIGIRAYHINGLADDLRFYNKEKSADFIRELYQKTLNGWPTVTV